MKILETKLVEECLDGVVIKEALLDEPIDEGFIRSLEDLGKLEYFPHFPKPFFRVRKSGNFIIKGVQGNNTCQIFWVNYSEETEKNIYRHIEVYAGG